LENVTENFQITSRQALTFGLLGAFTLALVSILLDFMLSQMNLYTILFWFGTGGIVSILVFLGVKRLQGNTEFGDVTVPSAGTISLMISGCADAIAYFTLVWALQTGPVSIVVAIVNLEVLLVFFGVLALSHYTPEVLEEEMDRVTIVQKFTAASLMLTGVVLIQLYT
jgi:uncharacterized membrane protein